MVGAVRRRINLRRRMRGANKRVAQNEQATIDAFHRLYYGRSVATWGDTWWLGVKVRKCPLDLWAYQEILYDTQPDLIVETGTAEGGSALFLATLCDVLGRGEVVSVDIEPGERPAHDRIRYLEGSSVDTAIVKSISTTARGHDRVTVILDSDHSRDHVRSELQAYSPLVTPGCHLIVEDTNVNGHPVHPRHGPGPHEAVDEFLAHHREFERDRRPERHLVTFNPGGYLLRTR
jgi:cephalosporin hydroxylase